MQEVSSVGTYLVMCLHEDLQTQCNLAKPSCPVHIYTISPRQKMGLVRSRSTFGAFWQCIWSCCLSRSWSLSLLTSWRIWTLLNFLRVQFCSGNYDNTLVQNQWLSDNNARGTMTYKNGHLVWTQWKVIGVPHIALWTMVWKDKNLSYKRLETSVMVRRKLFVNFTACQKTTETTWAFKSEHSRNPTMVTRYQFEHDHVCSGFFVCWERWASRRHWVPCTSVSIYNCLPAS